MATEPTTTAYAVWNHLLAEREKLIHSRQDEQRLAVIEDQLLLQAAPDIAGVLIKLEAMWEATLHGKDQASRQKLQVIADLKRLATA